MSSTFKELAEKGQAAVYYDVETNEYRIHKDMCPYWLAKFFGRFGDSPFMVRIAHVLIMALEDGAETAIAATAMASPRDDRERDYIVRQWMRHRGYDVMCECNRIYEKADERPATFADLLLAGYRSYLAYIAVGLFAIINEE